MKIRTRLITPKPRRLTPLSTKGTPMKGGTPKQQYICHGGPYHGSKLWLSKDRPSTAEFSVREFKGRYVIQRVKLANGAEIDSQHIVEWISSC